MSPLLKVLLSEKNKAYAFNAKDVRKCLGILLMIEAEKKNRS